MINFKTYNYEGSVYIDDHKIKDRWKSQTAALDRKDAYNRFVMRWRYLMDGTTNWPTKIVLPGKLKEIGQ